VLMLALAACDGTTREARRMVKRAERLADTLPDSTARLIDSVLRMPVNFRERERMDMALLQAEALFGDRGQEISPVMDGRLLRRPWQPLHQPRAGARRRLLRQEGGLRQGRPRRALQRFRAAALRREGERHAVVQGGREIWHDGGRQPYHGSGGIHA